MVDIVQTKKNNVLVYPQTHVKAVLGIDEKKVLNISTPSYPELSLNFTGVGKIATVTMWATLTKAIVDGETSLGKWELESFYPNNAFMVRGYVMRHSTPHRNKYFDLYINKGGDVYIYCEGLDSSMIGTNVYISHTYVVL